MPAYLIFLLFAFLPWHDDLAREYKLTGVYNNLQPSLGLVVCTHLTSMWWNRRGMEGANSQKYCQGQEKVRQR